MIRDSLILLHRLKQLELEQTGPMDESATLDARWTRTIEYVDEFKQELDGVNGMQIASHDAEDKRMYTFIRYDKLLMSVYIDKIKNSFSNFSPVVNVRVTIRIPGHSDIALDLRKIDWSHLLQPMLTKILMELIFDG